MVPARSVRLVTLSRSENGPGQLWPPAILHRLLPYHTRPYSYSAQTSVGGVGCTVYTVTDTDTHAFIATVLQTGSAGRPRCSEQVEVSNFTIHNVVCERTFRVICIYNQVSTRGYRNDCRCTSNSGTRSSKIAASFQHGRLHTWILSTASSTRSAHAVQRPCVFV